MGLLNDLLSKCIKRDEIKAWIPRNLDILQKRVEEKYWDEDEFKRTLYQNYCANCTCKYSCKLIRYRTWNKKNTVINEFGNGTVEIIRFDKPLNCIEENVNEDGPERNYIEIDGMLFPKDENLPNYKFLENMNNSARQSVDKYWGYAKSNRWDYFITLTSSPDFVADRYDDDEFKNMWTLCRKKLQRFDQDVKILVVPERHKKFDEYGRQALHMHGFIATDKQWTMKLMLDPKTGEQMYSKSGAPLFEFPFWNKGLATCAILPRDENEVESQLRVVSYLSKYMGKEHLGQVGYGKKRFYHTINLDFKDKQVVNIPEVDFKDLVKDFEVYKEQGGRTYYRAIKSINDEGEIIFTK